MEGVRRDVARRARRTGRPEPFHGWSGSPAEHVHRGRAPGAVDSQHSVESMPMRDVSWSFERGAIIGLALTGFLWLVGVRALWLSPGGFRSFRRRPASA